jgi:hypothetical protein
VLPGRARPRGRPEALAELRPAYSRPARFDQWQGSGHANRRRGFRLDASHAASYEGVSRRRCRARRLADRAGVELVDGRAVAGAEQRDGAGRWVPSWLSARSRGRPDARRGPAAATRARGALSSQRGCRSRRSRGRSGRLRRGAGGVHARMRLDREIRIGSAEGEDVLPLLVSVAPFRLGCLNGMLLPLAGAQRGPQPNRPARACSCSGPRDRALSPGTLEEFVDRAISVRGLRSDAGSGK